MKHLHSEAGFTLIELLLAMTVFTLTMVVATVGFIGMNRAYVRGTVRKQLSQDTQRSIDAIASTIRSDGRALDKHKSCPSGNSVPVACPGGGNWNGAICFNGERFIWGNTGLYHQGGGIQCNASTANFETTGTRLLDIRFKVEDLRISEVTGQNSLFTVQGVFRTTDDDSFDNLADPDKTNVVCKGSAFGLAQLCAVEKFKSVINARGGQSS